MKTIFKYLKQLFKRRNKYTIGEIVFTEDNGYVKIDNIVVIKAVFSTRVFIYVTLLEGKPGRRKEWDVYYNFKSLYKLPKDSLIHHLY